MCPTLCNPMPPAGGVRAQRSPPALHPRISLPLLPGPLPHLCSLSFFCLFWKQHSLMRPRCQHPIVSSSSLTSPAPVFPRLDLTQQPLAPHQLYPTVGIGQRPRRGQSSGPRPRVCPAAPGARVPVTRPRPRPPAEATRAPSLPAAASPGSSFLKPFPPFLFRFSPFIFLPFAFHFRPILSLLVSTRSSSSSPRERGRRTFSSWPLAVLCRAPSSEDTRRVPRAIFL